MAMMMKKAGMVNEAGLAQTEATYFNICTTVLDLKEQINQAENSLALLLAETPHKIQRGKSTVAGKLLRGCSLTDACQPS